MSWTDERIDRLKQMWGDGMSASQIAAQLGGVTRNAVIGKVHRLKLDSRLKAVASAPALAETPSAPVVVAAAPAFAQPLMEEARPAPRLVTSTPAPVAAAPVPRPASVPTSFGATALKFEPAPEPELDDSRLREGAEIVPMSRNLTLVQLSDRTCKWPLGDPLSPDFRFCGNHSGDGTPYCAHHARIAFQPASERRRVR